MRSSRLLTTAVAVAISTVTGALLPAGAAVAAPAAGGDRGQSCPTAWHLVAAPPIPGSSTIAAQPQAGTADVGATGGLVSSVDLLSPHDGWIAANTYTGPSWDGVLDNETGPWILRWNGHRVTPAAAQIPLSLQVPPAPGLSRDVTDVSFDSDTDGWALGTNYDTWNFAAAWRWNGGHWTLTPIAEPPTNTSTKTLPGLGSVISLSPSDAWAAGGWVSATATGIRTGPLIEHWDGTQWTVVPNPAPARPGLLGPFLSALAAVSPTDVWAVGEKSTSSGTPVPLVEHWDGTTWSEVPTPPGNSNSALYKISAVSGNDIWAVGAQTEPGTSDLAAALAEHWDGRAWTVVKLPDLGNSELTGVYAAGPSDVYATADQYDPGGGYGQTVPVFLHWDGSTWTTQTDPLGPREYGVSYFYGSVRGDSFGPSTSWGGITGSGSGTVMASGFAYDWANQEPSPQLARLTSGCSTKP